MKKKLIAITLILGMLSTPLAAFADAAVGDQIVTIGTNLNAQQRQEVLNYFGAGENAQIIDVDISEERKYLSGKIPDAQIGNSTNSCAMITYTKKGSGVNVRTNNINYVTAEAYASALMTAGVSDADIKVTAPMEVSGTGALTGIMKAYEVSTGETIDEDVKQAATSELVTNAELGQEVGNETANEIVNGIKTQIAEKNPQTEADYKAILDEVLAQTGVTLSDAQYQQLLDMIRQLAGLDIDWNKVAQNVSDLAGKASAYLQTEEGQGFLNSLQNIVNSFFDWLRDVFGGGSSDNTSDATTQDTTQTEQTTTVDNSQNVVEEETYTDAAGGEDNQVSEEVQEPAQDVAQDTTTQEVPAQDTTTQDTQATDTAQ